WDSLKISSITLLKNIKYSYSSFFEAEAYRGLGTYYYNTHQLDSAYFYYKEAMQRYRRLKKGGHVTHCLIKIADVESLQQRNDLAEEHNLNALGYLDRKDYPELRFSVYTNLGICAFNSEDYTSSLYWHEKALKEAVKNNQSYNISLSRNNIAACFQKTGLHNKALNIYRTTLRDLSRPTIDNAELYALLIQNIAEIKFARGYYREAINDLYVSNNIRKKYNYWHGESYNRLYLSKAYLG